MRRIFFFFVTANVIISRIESLSCVNNRGQRGRCINLFDCIPAFNAFKNNDAQPDTGTCEEDNVCCVENVRSLKIYEKRCLEYFLYAFEDVYVSDDPEEEPALSKNDKCTMSSVPFIVGGTTAEANEFPHMASIGDDRTSPISWFCGGSLISDRFVLSAAHCFMNNRRVEPRIVRLGTNSLIQKADSQIDASVARVIRHPGFRDSAVYNDIALIELSARVRLSPKVKPACLPSETLNQIGAKSLIATGWGATEHAGFRSNELLKAHIDTYDHTSCKQIYGKKYLQLRQGLNDNFICLLDPSRKKDTCQGDSGGPVQIVHKHVYCSYIVYGVTSAGVGCADRIGVPTLYTNVYNYVDWITSIVWE